MTEKTRKSIEEVLKEQGFSEKEISEAFAEYLSPLSDVEGRTTISPALKALRLQDKFVDHDGSSFRVVEPETQKPEN